MLHKSNNIRTWTPTTRHVSFAILEVIQMHSDFGSWDAQGQWKVLLCNSAASRGSARSLRPHENRLWCIHWAFKPDVQHKIPQTGSLALATCSSCWHSISRSIWKGQAAGNAKKYWPNTACSMWCNHDGATKPLTKHYHERTNITMLHHVTQEQTHPHINS